jgi:4-nitrophenyl phosphatase
VEWLQRLTDAGAPWCLVSNNTTHRPAALVAQLAAAGFPVTAERLVGALTAAVGVLRRRGAGRLLWLGAPGLADWWREMGFELAEGGGAADAVVLGVNPELTVAQLDAALPAMLSGAPLVCLHRNAFWLDDAGSRRLGPGVWAAALEALGGAGGVETVGKPSPDIYNAGLERVGAAAGETLFISDDPEADLVTAGRLGMTTAFVLSGKHADHAVLGRMEQDDWPDIICQRLAELPLPGEGAGAGAQLRADTRAKRDDT